MYMHACSLCCLVLSSKGKVSMQDVSHESKHTDVKASWQPSHRTKRQTSRPPSRPPGSVPTVPTPIVLCQGHRDQCQQAVTSRPLGSVPTDISGDSGPLWGPGYTQTSTAHLQDRQIRSTTHAAGRRKSANTCHFSMGGLAYLKEELKWRVGALK